MGNKKYNDYSTSDSWKYEEGSNDLFDIEPKEQNLRIRYERKGRGGKEVTLVTGWVGKAESLKDLCKQLQKTLGTGGAAKEGEIILQGKHTEKVRAKLLDLGYSGTKGS